MPTELNREGRLSQVLRIFNKLVASPSTEELGFFVLNTVVENRGSDVFAPYIGHIWIALFLKVVSTLLILSLLASMSFQSVYTLSDFVVVQGSNTILVAGAKSCTAESSI